MQIRALQGSNPSDTKEATRRLLLLLFCGETGIRTLGTRKGTTVFETAPIDHSGISPWSFASAKLDILF